MCALVYINNSCGCTRRTSRRNAVLRKRKTSRRQASKSHLIDISKPIHVAPVVLFLFPSTHTHTALICSAIITSLSLAQILRMKSKLEEQKSSAKKQACVVSVHHLAALLGRVCLSLSLRVCISNTSCLWGCVSIILSRQHALQNTSPYVHCTAFMHCRVSTKPRARRCWSRSWVGPSTRPLRSPKLCMRFDRGHGARFQ